MLNLTFCSVKYVNSSNTNVVVSDIFSGVRPIVSNRMLTKNKIPNTIYVTVAQEKATHFLNTTNYQ